MIFLAAGSCRVEEGRPGESSHETTADDGEADCNDRILKEDLGKLHICYDGRKSRSHCEEIQFQIEDGQSIVGSSKHDIGKAQWCCTSELMGSHFDTGSGAVR